MKAKNIVTLFFGAGLLATSSCKKNFLEVNVDPNNPTTASVDLVLPTALVYSAYDLGNPYQVLGGFWAQYWTQGPTGNQFSNYDQYSINSGDFDRQWIDVYAGPLNDLKYIVAEGQKTGNDNYAAIAKIMQAYLFQYVTDMQGDVPFAEALQGATNLNPKFNTQQEVYDGLITLVDEGLALLDENSNVHPGADDLFYHGDMHLWQKFANTLKLKIYLRQAYVRPAVAEAGVKALYAAGAEFLDFEETAQVNFTTATFNQHPLFAHINSVGEFNILASQTALGYMLGLNDPRIDKFYRRATLGAGTGQHVGIPQGKGRILPNPATLDDRQFSKPGPAVGGAPASGVGGEAPVIFMSEAESYFLQAEAVVRGWGTGDAEQLYNDAIELSFLYWGFTSAQFNTYKAQSGVTFPAAGTTEQKLKAIITQKWVSMCGTQNIEAWTEWRRTGYPDIFTVSETTIIGNKFPTRLLYPDSEVTANPNTPAQKTVTDKMWWDVNTTGQN
ncbi:SusD/RagB family nutrient-binding outer membrane lipoprotein [Terrimonas pollutisoli]|uniref:SusD/RagB family nutrient-binding outer membrane lipoprotein n=1 Tax=Terrimonas pollutisoli TaxID=3034147 RepID=UPI0023EC7DD6|nr:SusD/RagB family nutrient-binding outer membrane lipoprotein [Terrimonas sp. H1YJ31]